MNTEQYKAFLLANIPTASLASGGSEINCRCMYCPDSTDFHSKHFYISIPKDENTPSFYNCFKCGASGIVTHKKLLEWNIYDSGLAQDLLIHNNNCAIKTKNSKYYNRETYNVFNTKISMNEYTDKKLSYINNRLGLSLSYNDIRQLKIVLNLYDIINENHVINLTREEFICNQLNDYFLGFLSIDNAFINMRRLVPEGKVYKSIDKRYVNYKLFDKTDSSERFYTIPTMIDLSKPINLHIAEGPFDILSIYKNVRKEEMGIYSACAGCNYMGLILYFIDIYKLPYVNIHIYADNDKSGSNNNMQKIAYSLRQLKFPIFIHRNIYENEKDFGVRPENIKENIIQIM